MDGSTSVAEYAHARDEHEHKLKYEVHDTTPMHISLLYGLQVRDKNFFLVLQFLNAYYCT